MSGRGVGDEADRGGELAGVRHGEVDAARADPLSPRGGAAGEAYLGLGTAGDLDLLPGEAHAAAERLAHRLLAGEARRVALGGVGPRVAVGLLGLGEAAGAESRPLERLP